MNGQLTWTPVFDAIRSKREECVLLISPFIQAATIERLLAELIVSDGLQVITRWNPHDLIAGVSDVEVFKVLEARNVPLYINSDIHLKLSVFSNDNAFHSSGNITAKGMGLAQNSNVEIGCDVILTNDDWNQIHRIFSASRRVDEAMYLQAKQYANNNKSIVPPLPPLQFTPTGDVSAFSRHSLPSTNDPVELWCYYSEDEFSESRSKYSHDLFVFGIDDGTLSKPAFFDLLKTNFRNHPFIQEIVEFIRQEGEVRFGAMNAWIVTKCTDKPVPFRWELKSSTNRLYDWLSFFFDEITWDRPGYSQVIRWKG